MTKNESPKTIAICTAGISNDYNDMFLKSFYKHADDYNFKLLYFYSFSDFYYGNRHDKGEANIFQLINYSIIDGLIILYETFKDYPNNPDNSVPNSIIEKAKQANVPVVCVDHHIDGCYNISFNYDKAMKEIVTHFVEHHHFSRINFVAGIKGNDFSEHRLNIFREVMAEHNLPVEEDRIGYGGFWADPTNAVMDKFLSGNLPMPEVIICANDTMAITVYQRLIEAGYRVPEDVTLSGFDGIEEALSHVPSFTTAQHNFDKTSQTAFDILTQYFHGETPPDDSYIDSKVIIGQSCGCVRTHTNAGNKLNRELYQRIDDNNNFLYKQVDMIAALTDNNSFDDIFHNMRQFIIEIPSPKIWICIVNDFIANSTQFEDEINSLPARSSVYSRQMEVLLYKQDYDFISLANFSVSQMIPNLEKAFADNNNILFMPLHVHDKTIGYFAMVYSPEYTHFYEMYTFTMNIANALESTKTHIKQQKIIKTLEDKYIHDPMTNLFNRRGFYQHLNPLYEECVQSKRRLMVISIDLNGLKPINDNYGHAEGDNAIITVAKALMSISMKDEICARFGGDEYVVAGIVDEDDSYVDEYTQKFQSYLDYYNQHSNKEYTVSASLGMVVCVPHKDQTLDQCIKEADDKMYAIKAKHHLCRSR